MNIFSNGMAEGQVTAGEKEMARAHGLGSCRERSLRPSGIRCMEENEKIRDRSRILEKTEGETGLGQRGKRKSSCVNLDGQKPRSLCKHWSELKQNTS